MKVIFNVVWQSLKERKPEEKKPQQNLGADQVVNEDWCRGLEDTEVFSSMRVTLFRRSPDFLSEAIMINRALKTIRQFHGLTQAELALKLDMSKSYLVKLNLERSLLGMIYLKSIRSFSMCLYRHWFFL